MRYVEGAALKLPEGNLRFLLGFGGKAPIVFPKRRL